MDPIISLITFALVTTFTPGPNNITAASFGVQIGYLKTIKYLLGIASGFFMMMLLSAFLSKGLIEHFPKAAIVLKYVGFCYIIYLGFKILRYRFKDSNESRSVATYRNGLLMQLVNPKVIVYGLTIFNTFIFPLTDKVELLIVSSLSLALLSFTSISSWTLMGSVIRVYLKNDKLLLMINITLFLLLIYTAISILMI